MTDTLDPIALLRDFMRSKQRIDTDREKRELNFDSLGYKLPFDTQTAWKRSDGKGYYSLGALWLSIQLKEARLSDYAKECGKLKIPQIYFGDQKLVYDFFTKSTEESHASIDGAYWAKTLLRKADIRAGRVLQSQEKKDKLRKRDEKLRRKEIEVPQQQAQVKIEKQLEVFDHLMQNEKRIHTRVTVLQSKKHSFLKVLLLGYQMVSLKDKAEQIKQRIEDKGPIAKDVNLDVNFLKPAQQKLSLLDDILKQPIIKGEFGATRNQRAHPIIVVPAMHSTGNISLANVANFLEKGTYEDVGPNFNSDDKCKEVTKLIGGREVTFDVFDSVTNFTETKWQRVVAVFVNGDSWQFRDWKTTASSQGSGPDIRQLFTRVRGYHMSYLGSKAPPSIAGWNVLKLELPKHKRHHDVNVQAKFWQDFELFLKKEKFKGCNF